jgi:menaquinone-dependent protoporphyrinogen oxidase
MSRTLIIYSTIDGQTKAICERIASLLVNAKTEIMTIEQADRMDYLILIKSSLELASGMGKHRPELYNFLKKHREELEKIKSAFFSVNVVARKPLKNTPETNPYMIKFLGLTPWRPDQLAVFAGKIDYPKYGFIDKQMIRFIMWMTKGPTDISGTFEFTDWSAVEDFAERLSS